MMGYTYSLHSVNKSIYPMQDTICILDSGAIFTQFSNSKHRNQFKCHSVKMNRKFSVTAIKYK